ncbi:hypothetical protein [Paraburkholderia sp. DHOC27]|nr:hypothetical protein [Paraburkholderia sp. DHOC27]
MTQLQTQLSQHVSISDTSPTARLVASMMSIRTVAVSLLVDRALSA